MRKAVLIFLVLLIGSGLQARVANGELTLKESFFQTKESIELDGKWKFYWGELVDPIEAPELEGPPRLEDIMTPWANLKQNNGGFHAKGSATYELEIFSNRESDQLAFHIPEFYSSYVLYLNGEEIARNGNAAESIADAVPYWLPRVAPFKINQGSNRLVLHVSNFHHHKGGSVAPITVGHASKLFFYRNLAVSVSLFIAGALLISALISIIIYYFQKTDFAFLFFGLFAVTYIYRIVGTDTYFLHQVFEGLSWFTAIRLEYLTLFLSVIFFTYFYRFLIARRAPEWMFHTVGGVSLLMSLATLLPPQNFSAFIDYYLIFVLVALVTISFFYLRTIHLSHTMSWFTTISILSLISVMALKMSALFGFGGGSVFLSAFLYFVFLVTQTIALSQRFGYNLREHVEKGEVAAVSQQNFMNSVSHELRTPMNAILGMTEFLSKTELDTDQKTKLETIRKNGEQLNNILLDLLDFSAIDSGEMELETKKFGMKEVLDKALELAGANSLKAGISFKLEYDENIPEELVGDPERLSQVIFHLVNNAIKFTEKGIITLDLRIESIEGNRVKLVLKVTDTGVGIKPEELQKVVQAFNQGDGGNTRKHGGTGLGLTISSKVIELMDGDLWIDSEPGKGTIVTADFIIKTPRMNLSKHAEEIKQENDKKIDNLRILYAEDNPINQKLLVMIMKTMGYEVDLANDGLEAWEMAITNDYHIIFMDIQMPKMDGIESTKRIIKDQVKRPIIIAVTANAEVADQKRCIEAGMNDFIPKPFNAKMLKDALKKWQGLLSYMEEGEQGDQLRVIS